MDHPTTPKVPITCPEIDDLRDLVKLIPDAAARSRAVAVLEVVREKNRQLRANERTWRLHARELGRLLDVPGGSE